MTEATGWEVDAAVEALAVLENVVGLDAIGRHLAARLALDAVLSARPLIERVGLPPQLADEVNAVATAKHAEASARAPARALWAPYGWHELDAGNRSTLLRVRSSPLVSAC
jgi:hypothetical protein